MSECAEGGCWMAYYGDWSGFAVFAKEIDALRHAVEGSMNVVWVPWGESPRAVVNRASS